MPTAAPRRRGHRARLQLAEERSSRSHGPLQAVLTVIQTAQTERGRARLAMHGLTKRQKDRIIEERRAAGLEPQPAWAPVKLAPASEDRLGATPEGLRSHLYSMSVARRPRASSQWNFANPSIPGNFARIQWVA